MATRANFVCSSAARTGIDELLPTHDPPSDRYLLGTLFPQETDAVDLFEDDVVDDAAGEVGDDIGDDPIVLANQHMPSSLAISFLVDGAAIAVEVRAGRYVKEDGWQRSQNEATFNLSPTQDAKVSLFGLAATLHQKWRPSEDGSYLVTLALVNEATGGRPFASEKCLYQVGIRVRVAGSFHILPYATSGAFHLDDEAEELALLYRHRPAYAVGHGCATHWAIDDSGHPEFVETTYLPAETVPDINFELIGFDDVMSLSNLSRMADNPAPALDGLNRFVDAYESWVTDLSSHHADIPRHLDDAKQRILGRLIVATSRMRNGVEYLNGNKLASEAFALANRAMLMQMRHSREDFGGLRKKRDSTTFVPPNYDAIDDLHWRPFQLAFLLLAVEGTGEQDADERNLVDLIWFPTGGGKTEAYLALVAFVVMLRRLRHGDDGGGTSVITRYTLRLLTSQQFQRAAALICACEIIRRGDPARLGRPPVSIGIWLGGSASPNRYQDARELLDQMKGGERPGLSFQLELCPWCGTELVPDDPGDDRDYGVRASDTSFGMFCPTATCPFHEFLPVSSVDDDLYEHPPTMLIATVDKFAQMAWQPGTGAFLGDAEHPGPDLIIQDELHLISGPLGTMVALYESAFDLVITDHGRRPKVVASTATIRSADRHASSVFGRPVFVFPPSGLDSDDSYFVTFSSRPTGRKYVGLMAQAHTPTTGLVRTAAVLLQAPVELQLEEPDLDYYWTLVAYHNSLRELGKTVTLARDDIPAWIDVITTAHDRMRELDADNDVIEITSNIPPYMIPRNLEVLQRRQNEPGVASVVACTNMISVGVDVQRLGLMLVYGQPKSTSEYIQATSRVGRSGKGLIVTLYSPAKSRGRRFESFRWCHSGVAQRVERFPVKEDKDVRGVPPELASPSGGGATEGGGGGRRQ